MVKFGHFWPRVSQLVSIYRLCYNQEMISDVIAEVEYVSITSKDVAHVANLARLKLTDQEMEQYTEQLNKILQHAEELQKLDLENVEPTSHVLPIQNVMRDDRTRQWLTNEQALSNAPDEDEGQFRVPAVMEG
ncbi:hypothetical protein skT53_20940 [Effusibacillus dendaii]|uniref:Aspartyl/glutamyl-tRNA(Asn/Gln) amidotransferase subunit C n=1 Tax=Effusibacillus dendaii TaxID=2743772 RepID=A0A7I8DDS4_9BACL|nr:hypothetical protein skT53_20940 [Effusibacillus dendaii]